MHGATAYLTLIEGVVYVQQFWTPVSTTDETRTDDHANIPPSAENGSMLRLQARSTGELLMVLGGT